MIWNDLPYVRWAGIDIFQPHRAMTTRRLYDHEIVYTLSGEGFIIYDGVQHFAGIDHCFFNCPRVPHSSSNQSEQPWVTIGIHFDWHYSPDVAQFPSFRADDGSSPTDESLFRAPELIEGWNPETQPVLDLRGRPAVRHYLEEVITAFSRRDHNSHAQAGGLLVAAICQIEREARLLTCTYNSAAVGPDAQRRLNDARDFLEKVGEEMLTVAQIASRIGWSSDYLSFMAREAWGVSPRAVQMEARLRRARELLRDGVAVSEVARLCGFADTSHLGRAFRKESGLTPREYSALAARHD